MLELITFFSIILQHPIGILFFFLNDPPPTEFYPLPLHDALPIFHAHFMPLYFSALVVAPAASCAILVAVRDADPRAVPPYAKGLLAFLAAAQVLLLPVNYGVLIVDKTLTRVAVRGVKPIESGELARLFRSG